MVCFLVQLPIFLQSLLSGSVLLLNGTFYSLKKQVQFLTARGKLYHSYCAFENRVKMHIETGCFFGVCVCLFALQNQKLLRAVLKQ